MRKSVTAEKQAALAEVNALAKKLGPLFSWAARKHLAIRAAEKAAKRIQADADRKIARLKRIAS